MATTTELTAETCAVAALFKDHDDAQNAVQALLEKGYAQDEISLTVELDMKEDYDARKAAMKAKGFEDPDAKYMEKAISEGDTLLTVIHVEEEKTGEVVKLLNENGSHYNPDGSRNVRQDVVGMTTGAAVGGVTGALIGGPIGAGIGTGIGAGIGGAIGDHTEKQK